MAVYSSQLCSWTANGDTECKENFITIDSGGAKLGQSCAKEDCIEGTCFRASGEENGTCRHVLMIGDKGCKKTNHVCTNGLYCYDNTCLRRPPSTRGKDINDNTPKKDNTQTYMYILYGFSAIIIVLLIIMIFLLFSQSSQNVSSNI